MLIAKTTIADSKLMKLVLNCAKFELNEAINNTKVKVDTKLIELVLNCTESMLNQAINNINTKAGNLELKIDVQYAYQAKLGKVTRKPSKLETKWVFLSLEAEMLFNNSSKISNFPSYLFF
jgi:hypothetical protein